MKVITALTVALIVLKFIVLPLGSHPYDFAVFVYQPRSFFEFGIDPMFALNKGVPYLALFYLPYAVYTTIQLLFHQAAENVFLLHFFFKFPLLMLDLGLGLLIRSLINNFSPSRFYRKYGLLLWLACPFVFWMSEFQGQYAVAAAFFGMLALYLLLVKKRFVLSMICLAAASSIYYYAIIFLPFFALWAACSNLNLVSVIKKTFIGAAAFLASTLIFYLPFILKPLYLTSLVGSLLHHAAPDAPSLATQIEVPQYSLFKIPYYTLNGVWPSNINSPGYFKLVSLMTFVGLGVVALYTVYRIYSSLKHNKYELKTLLADNVIVLTLFLALVGKFQSHYVVWVLPLLLFTAAVYSSGWLLQMYGLLSLVPVFVVLTTLNLSVFLLDILPANSVTFFLGQSAYAQAFGGFTVVLILVSCIVFFIRAGDYILTREVSWLIAGITFVFYLSVVVVSARVYTLAARSSSNRRLASEQLVYNFNFKSDVPSHRTVSTQLNPAAFPDSGFELVTENRLVTSGYLDEGRSPWRIYSFGEAGAARASVIREQPHASKRVKIEAAREGAKAQISLGSEAMVRVDANKLYRVESSLMSTKLSGGVGEFSIRFADSNRRVISGSDVSIAQFHGPQGWARFGKDISPPRNAWYVQTVITLKETDGRKIEPGSNIYADDFSLSEKREASLITLSNLRPVSPNAKIYETILNQPSVAQKYNFKVTLKSLPPYASVLSSTLNGCTVPFDPEDLNGTRLKGYDTSINTSCFSTSKPNQLTLYGINLEDPTIKVLLAHNVGNFSIPSPLKQLVLLFGICGVAAFASSAFFVLRRYKHFYIEPKPDLPAPSPSSDQENPEKSVRRAIGIDGIRTRRNYER